MEDSEVREVEARLTLGLRAFDALPVPDLGRIRVARRGFSALDALAPAALVAAIIVAAAIGGARLSALDGASPAANPGRAVSAPTLSPNYGLLSRATTDKSSRVAIVDELGGEVLTGIDSLVAARTSPDGHFVALLLATQQRTELRMFDGASRILGPALLSTDEEFGRTGDSVVWASDSSAVLVASAPRPRVGDDASVQLRSVTLAGEVRPLTTLRTFALALLAWDRTHGIVTLRRTADASGGAGVVVALSESGATVFEHAVAESIVTADDGGRMIVTAGACGTQPPCRRLAVRDVATEATVTEIALPPTASATGIWGATFLPRSADLVVWFSREMLPGRGTFDLALYRDGGRGTRVDLGELVVEAIGGRVYPPSVVVRADGTSLLYTHPTGAPGNAEGVLVDTASGARVTVTIAAPLASVVLAPRR